MLDYHCLCLIYGIEWNWIRYLVPDLFSDNGWYWNTTILLNSPNIFLNVRIQWSMMTSSNGNIFRVTGPLCGEFTGSAEFPAQRPVTRGFDVFFYLRLNKRLNKQPWGWWFEMSPWSLWRQCNDLFRHTKNENNEPAYTSAAIFITIQANWLTKFTKILYHIASVLFQGI